MVTAMDRDIVLYIQVAEPHQPRLIYEVRNPLQQFLYGKNMLLSLHLEIGR